MKEIQDNNSQSWFSVAFRSLSYRNYRLFFSGQTISLIGTWIQRIAMPWLVYHISNSAFLLGFVGFIGQMPTFLLAPFAGVITDRGNRYHILILTQVLSMIQALSLAFLYFKGSIQIWHIIILSLFLGLINAFDMPARQSFVVDMVEKKEDLGNAIALNSSMTNGARLLGPSIAGLLISAAGEGICFLINGLSYIFVIASLLFMKVNVKKNEKQDVAIWQGLKEGFSYTYHFAPIRNIILLLALVSLMAMPYAVLMPIFAKEILKGGPHTFGFLMGASGIGALAGALYLASRRSILGLGKIIPFSAAIFGFGIIAFALSRNFYLSLVFMVVTGFGMITQMASSNTLIQTIVEDDKRGRVMSLYALAFVGTAPFGSLLSGYLAKTIGAPSTLILGGIFCIIGALWFFRSLSTLRKIVHPIYVKSGIVIEFASGIQSATELTCPPDR